MSRWKKGFTLLELILVAAILGVMAAVTVPGFVQSIRGNRLRTAARNVISSGRYARSMAVMKQRRMGIFFDLKENTVAVRQLDAGDQSRDLMEFDKLAVSAESAADFNNGRRQDNEIGPEFAGATGATVQSGSSGAEFSISRELEGVEIQYVETEEGAQRFVEGRCSVAYEVNGRCSPYTVMLADSDGGRLVIDVDALASAEVNEAP